MLIRPMTLRSLLHIWLMYFSWPKLGCWSSKKQPLVARSSTEAEYRSMENTIAEILWIQSLLQESRVPFYSPVPMCDNLSVVSLTHNPILHAQTKHMELDLHFLREKDISKHLQVLHVPADDQLVDSCTKPLSTAQMPTNCSKLKVSSLQQPP